MQIRKKKYKQKYACWRIDILPKNIYDLKIVTYANVINF